MTENTVLQRVQSVSVAVACWRATRFDVPSYYQVNVFLVFLSVYLQILTQYLKIIHDHHLSNSYDVPTHISYLKLHNDTKNLLSL
jgi:hypothetical protein